MDHHSDRYQTLKTQFNLLKAIRLFFESRHFLDVLTPPVVENPGMETHIHPFSVHHTFKNGHTGKYLHTSPEFAMKEMMSLGFENIFSLSYCFRDEPEATHHRFQFIMLEWYRKNAHYTAIMKDVEELFPFCLEYLQGQKIETSDSFNHCLFQRATIQDLFLEYLNFDILNFLNVDDLKEYIAKNHKDVPLPVMGEKLSFDDYFFLLFLNKIEPQLKNIPFLLVYEFPYQLAALSTLKSTDQRVAERFEVYCHGIELCNSFNELTHLPIQKQRFAEQALEKKQLYGYELPEPKEFYQTMERGLPTSAGIALGVERFQKILTGTTNPFWK